MAPWNTGLSPNVTANMGLGGSQGSRERHILDGSQAGPLPWTNIQYRSYKIELGGTHIAGSSFLRRNRYKKRARCFETSVTMSLWTCNKAEQKERHLVHQGCFLIAKRGAHFSLTDRPVSASRHYRASGLLECNPTIWRQDVRIKKNGAEGSRTRTRNKPAIGQPVRLRRWHCSQFQVAFPALSQRHVTRRFTWDNALPKLEVQTLWIQYCVHYPRHNTKAFVLEKYKA